MKHIINEAEVKLSYDENKNRLLVVVDDIVDKQYNQLVDEVLKAIKERKADSILWLVQNQVPASKALMDHTVQQMNKALQEGLQRFAIVKPSSPPEMKQLVENYVKDMNNSAVRDFSSRKEAEQWLDSAGSEQRKAA